MDTYTLQLTPRKKEEKNEEDKEIKVFKEHIFTKAEVIADLKKNDEKGFLGRFFSGHGGKEVSEKKDAEKSAASTEPAIKSVAEEKIAVAPVKQKNEPEILTQAIILDKMETEVEEVATMKECSPEKQNEPCIILAPNFKGVAEEGKSKKRATRKKFNHSPEKHIAHLDEPQRKILDLLIEAVRSDEDEKMRIALEELAQLRTDDEYECQNDAPLNVAIRREFFSGISAMLAHKGIKDVVRLFQLIDMLNLEMTTSDFSILPAEVLESSEMHTVAVKYLMWCAKEYEQVPAEFEKRIICFVQAGILTFTEIHELPELQEVISGSLLEYAKEHMKNPVEIDRKISQYSLAGFLNGKVLKKSEKIKELSKDYLMEIMEKYQDRTEEIEKRIREYERVGFLERKDLREDEKVQKIIEKLLTKYVKANKMHPRKISGRVKEYFNMGIITKDAMDSFLQNA